MRAHSSEYVRTAPGPHQIAASRALGLVLCTGVSDGNDNKPHPVGGGQDQLSGAGGPHQNAQLLLTPASLQLAQLQAQLTLHRLKLAQGAVGGNANAAAAASVLNQVLSNVAMSQPLFNQLRASAMVGNAQAVGGGFHSGALAFQPPPPPPLPPNAAMGTLVGSGFSQNHGNVRLNHYGGGGVSGNQQQQQQANQHGGSEYGKKAESTYPADRYGFLDATSAASSKVGDGQGQYVPVMTQAKSTNQGFQMDFYGQSDQSQQQQGGFCGGNQSEPNMNTFNEPQWKSPATRGHTVKGMDLVANTATVWTATGKPFRARGELYNPEEPTADPKFNPDTRGVTSSFVAGTGGTQGFLGYHKQPQQGVEETLSTGGSLQLHPHQLNDYLAVPPSHLPHQCTICEKKVYNLKDWDQHVKGKLHLQNRSLYCDGANTAAGAVPYGPTGSSEGCRNTLGGNNSMAYSAAANQDVLSGANTNVYLPATSLKTYSMSGAGFTQLPPGSQTFPPRKSVPGRVVHICNLPEGSCTENDVINLGLPFGKVTNYILMRSTHQAFLEMAYIEAAQAMVQYYQLSPATINDQKLLIRMSKRYKELQLKKPGKDVDTIIQDINSQRERDEMQEVDHYMPERARSRSPISRSLSPRSHSPSFTSCSSAHSPPGAPCRGGPERGCGNGPRRGSWDWTAQHMRRGDEERERDREREEAAWRNGGVADDDRSNGRMHDRRNKPYPKPPERISPRSAEERGSGGGEGMRGGNRGGDWHPHPRGSPQGMPHYPSYRNMDEDEDFYKKEQVYKPEMPLRPQYERHEEGRTKTKRRDGGDYHSRPRHQESQPPPAKTAENRRQEGGRSKKPTKRHDTEKPEKEATEHNGATAEDQPSKEKSASPPRSAKHEGERAAEAEWESGEDTEGECWYPKNMEELVTVDEVGEDDSIIEPDLPELQEHDDPSLSATGPTGEVAEEALRTASKPCPEIESAPREETESGRGGGVSGLGDSAHTEKAEDILTSPEASRLPPPPPPLPAVSVASETAGSKLNDFPTLEFKAALEETCLTGQTPVHDTLNNHVSARESNKTQEEIHKMEDVEKQVPATVTDRKDSQPEAGTPARVVQNLTHIACPINQPDTKAYSPSMEQEKAISEHSIPLGVEFIVPRTGFYCKLCGLFYTSEETAKTSHCRSTVHYRNLQKYLSQLAEESLLDALVDPAAVE
ncbi:RNA-binding protein 20 isoform X2 [Esox lucius]|uniref:RNA binding motif protein 20 n=1 Tax=Esox lucius TaxID=8010 RepID=A0A3P8Z6J9_ESOLU|nr:RNA-binding protein 20 isoform X2 [Esox lucius]